MNEKILIIGGNGLVGSFLTDYFKQKDNFVGIVARQRTGLEANEFIEADTTKDGEWKENLNHYDVIINLAGANIGKRWNSRYKKLIYDSRILTTRNIVDAIEKNKILFNTSAVGYYGDCGNRILTEESKPQTNDFLHRVCKDWEDEALKAIEKGTKVYIMRFGVVATTHGGAFQKLIKNHRYFVGSVIGRGDQYFSYIHIEDIANAIRFLIGKLPKHSIYNFTTPNPITNRELTYNIAKKIRRPVIIPFIPSFLFRIILGEFADTLLFSQRATPQNLLNEGYEFTYNNIQDVLTSIINV